MRSGPGGTGTGVVEAKLHPDERAPMFDQPKDEIVR